MSEGLSALGLILIGALSFLSEVFKGEISEFRIENLLWVEA